jgi:tetratricopeptide (TPR) repeat protein
MLADGENVWLFDHAKEAILPDSKPDSEGGEQPDLSREELRDLIKTFLARLAASKPPAETGEFDTKLLEQAIPSPEEPPQVPTEDFSEACNQVDDPFDFSVDSLSTDEQIEAAIESELWDDARVAIEDSLAAMPADWKPIQRDVGDGSKLFCSFWDDEEFMSFVANSGKPATENSVLWTDVSYSKRWWQLALVNYKQGHYRNALTCVERGLELEPDHPYLWMQRGHILSETKQYAQALTAFETAATARSWASPSITAWALRQQGYVLIELDRLDAAKAAYMRSLELEQNNETAAHQLEYIRRVLQECENKAKQLPWFLHALKFPPENPLTLQLIALVDGMETIAGPMTVGSENYAQISKAFYERKSNSTDCILQIAQIAST